MLNEVKRVTGWGFLIDHEAFPLLLAAITATNVLWFFPGINRILMAYYPQLRPVAAVHMMAPQTTVTSISEIDMSGGDTMVTDESAVEEVVGEL